MQIRKIFNKLLIFNKTFDSVLCNRDNIYNIGFYKQLYLQCDKHFASKRNLNRHLKTHDVDKPHKCIKCKKCFVRKEQLERHDTYHNPENYLICDYCKACFNRKQRLVVHIQVNHLMNLAFICEVCNKTFASGEILKRHKDIHSKESKYNK